MVGEVVGFGNCVNFIKPIPYDQTFDNFQSDMGNSIVLEQLHELCCSNWTEIYITSSSSINQALNHPKTYLSRNDRQWDPRI